MVGFGPRKHTFYPMSSYRSTNKGASSPKFLTIDSLRNRAIYTRVGLISHPGNWVKMHSLYGHFVQSAAQWRNSAIIPRGQD